MEQRHNDAEGEKPDCFVGRVYASWNPVFLAQDVDWLSTEECTKPCDLRGICYVGSSAGGHRRG